MVRDGGTGRVMRDGGTGWVMRDDGDEAERWGGAEWWDGPGDAEWRVRCGQV